MHEQYFQRGCNFQSQMHPNNVYYAIVKDDTVLIEHVVYGYFQIAVGANLVVPSELHNATFVGYLNNTSVPCFKFDSSELHNSLNLFTLHDPKLKHTVQPNLHLIQH